MKCGLLGKALSHSYSPQIHGLLGEYTYALFEKEPHQVEHFLQHGDFTGINVTIPYKKSVIPYLDLLTPTARKLGAVNTVVRREDGSLLGHNTDYYGFLSLVNRMGISASGKKALILGSGGASATASAVLAELGAEVIIISRSGKNNYTNLHLHTDAHIIVNATPVGMYPNNGASPLSLAQFSNLEAVIDLIYNPARTALLLEAEKLGIPNANGLWMLVAQAKEAAEYFTGVSISDGMIDIIYRRMKIQMENIVLIGMPGCGKSTVAAHLARYLGRPVLDSDTEIVRRENSSIPTIFENMGEAGFREKETAMLQTLGKKSGIILSTGGGAVTRKENYPLLHQNATIFWIQRDLTELPREGRPLSMTTDLTRMYAERQPMYQQFADFIIENCDSPENAAEKIIATLEASL